MLVKQTGSGEATNFFLKADFAGNARVQFGAATWEQ